jgi:adenine-specific DNA-methyltransferase
MLNAEAKAKIFLRDARRFLADLPENSADLILTSPPYFMGKEYDTSPNLSDFLEEHKALLPLLLRALRPNGSLCWQVGHHIQNGVAVPLDAVIYSTFSSPELQLRNRIIWTFGHGTHAKKRFSGRHETIMWYTKGADYFFDLDAVRVPQKYPGKKHYKGPNKGNWSGNPKGKNPSDVWLIPNVNANHPEKTAHPCQFPVGLAQRLIRALCPAHGQILDCYAGSGSTAVAAVIEGRSFLGCDINKSYVALARARIKEAQSGTVRYRPHDRAVYQPTGRDAVSTMPEHFAFAGR